MSKEKYFKFDVHRFIDRKIAQIEKVLMYIYGRVLFTRVTNLLKNIQFDFNLGKINIWRVNSKLK